MRGAGMTPRGFSAVVVLVTAVAFDVLARADGAHVLGVALAAGTVGATRVCLPHRAWGTFALLNLAVLAQPAALAVAALAPQATGMPPLALQLAVTLLVVTAAASEPLLAAVEVPSLARLLTVLVPDGPRPVAVVAPAVGTLVGADLARRLPRRGPPRP
ncbi:hypothetical protein [Actinomycetospora sp. CA-084318]|uniref:hypothetical protein n=1 Tax=Actinomycetospora sp. CA-084318 TaxID=3239892 RepID=UPI003D99524F